MTSFQKLENFFSKYKLLKYRKKEVLLRPGDTPQGVFLLKKGYVKLYSVCKRGKELILIIFKPDDFFPMIWAINNTERTHYTEAMIDVEVWRAPRDKFIDFVKKNPDILFELTSRILTRLGGLLQRMEYLAFGNAYEKVASILLICAERFGRKEGNNIIIQVPLTHNDIATLLGITRETASIELKKFQKKGVITYRGRFITVKDFRGLKEESLLNGA